MGSSYKCIVTVVVVVVDGTLKKSPMSLHRLLGPAKRVKKKKKKKIKRGRFDDVCFPFGVSATLVIVRLKRSKKKKKNPFFIYIYIQEIKSEISEGLFYFYFLFSSTRSLTDERGTAKTAVCSERENSNGSRSVLFVYIYKIASPGPGLTSRVEMSF